MSRVIVTGASGQIGSAICSKLTSMNIEVLGVDRNAGPFVTTLGDLADLDFLNSLEPLFTHPDVRLVNNAGVPIFNDPRDREFDEFQFIYSVNYFAPQKLMNFMLKNSKRGRVVNISSLYGSCVADQSIYINSDRSSSELYSTSKAAVAQLAKYYASRFGSEDFQFNTVSPGGVHANIDGQSAEFRERYCAKVPLGRMAYAEEVASVVNWLLLDAPNYLNGQNIFVDGGYSAR